MSGALRESHAFQPRAAGEAGRWAMDGAADRTQLLSVWRQQWDGRAQWRLSRWKRGGATWDLWLPCQTSLRCSLFSSCVWQSWIYDGQTEPLVTVGEGLSPSGRMPTTSTRRGDAPNSHQVNPITVQTGGFEELFLMCLVNMSMFTIRILIFVF